MSDETELRPWVKVFGVILLIALIVGCIYLLKAEMKQPSIINVDNDVNPIKDPRINRVYTDAFTISEHTDYDLTHNTVYLTITENIGKNQIINISSIFKDNLLTNKISYSDIYMNLSYDYKIYETVNISIGKYSKSNTTIDSLFNTTTTHYYYSNDTEMLCQSVLADKSCLVESLENIRNETRWDYQPLPKQKTKIVLNGLSVEFKDGGIPIAKNSTIQLRYSYEHPLAITKNTPAADVNKYDIEVCSADGIDCSILDPTWFNVSWGGVINVTLNASLIGGVLNDFPVYIDLSNITFNEFWGNVSSDGSDIRVVDNNGIELPKELVSINVTARTGELHFRGNLSNATANLFQIYFNNSEATIPADNAPNGRQAVWSDYIAVYHFNDGSGTNVIDSRGTKNGTASNANVTSSGLSGKVGKYMSNFSNNDVVDASGIQGVFKNVSHSISYWFKAQKPVDDMYSFSAGTTTDNPFFGIATTVDATHNTTRIIRRNDAGTLEINNIKGTTDVLNNKFEYASFTSANGNWTLYINGSIENVGLFTAGAITLTKFKMATLTRSSDGSFYSGGLDEMRLRTSNLSQDWVRTEYNNQNTPQNFYQSFVYAPLGSGSSDNDYPIFYGEATTANGSTYNPVTNYAFSIYINNTNGTAGIEFNGTNYTMQNASSQFTKILSQQRAGVFSYYYWAYGNGTSTNFNRTTAKAYTILQATNTQSLLLNGTTANVNLTYPSKINATGTCSVGASLTENVTVITSGLFRDLKVGYYNYTLTCTGNENYTTPAAISRFANITKGTGVVYTYLNGARNNLTISNGTTATLNGTLSSGSGIINLYKNDSLINTGTPSVQNSTLFDKIENWTIKANYTGNENWTAASEQWTLTVAAVGTITTALDSPIDNYKTNVSSVYFNWTITPSQMNITNWTYTIWNATSYLINQTIGTSYLCSQESANSSNVNDGTCNLQFTGLYKSGANIITNESYLYDSNWNTFGFGTNTGAYLFINYTFPSNDVNTAIWQVKSSNGIANYTIPISCFNKTKNIVQLRLYTWLAGGSDQLFGTCLNNTLGWQSIFGGAGGGAVYEEMIIWNVTSNMNGITTAYKTLSLSDGNYTWGVSACGNNSAGDYSCNTAANRTLTVDTVTPTISLIYPTNSTGLGTIGTNYTLNYTITDLNPETCGFVYNGVTSYMDCASYATFIFSNNRSITLFANDSAGNLKSTTYDKLFLIVENNQTYTSPVNEMSYQYFNINLTYNSTLFPGILANLIYNGTNYTATQNGTGDTIIFQRTIDVPLSGVKNLYWNIGITNTSGTFYYNSSVKTQSISGITLAFCNTTFNDTLVNFSVYDAQTTTKKVNSTFDIDFTYWTGSGRDSKNYSYKDTNKNVSSFKFCASPSNITYYVDADITFTGTGYAQNYHYFRNATLNATILEQPLYLLNAGNATITQLRILDAYQDGVPDRLIQIQYYDVGTGTYYLVGMAKTNYDGSDLVYLKWYDTYYKFIGTDFDGNVIFNYDPYKVGESPQTFKLGSTFTFDYNKFNDMTYNLYFNNATKNVVLTFLDPSGTITSGCLRVYRFSATNETIVYDECLATTSGTLTYNMGNQTGNFAATFYATGSNGVIDTIGFIVDAINEIYDTLDRADSAIYAFLVVGGAIFIGLFSPVAAIVLGLMGWVAATWLGFIKMTGNQIIAFIGIFIVGIFLAWKLRN